MSEQPGRREDSAVEARRSLAGLSPRTDEERRVREQLQRRTEDVILSYLCASSDVAHTSPRPPPRSACDVLCACSRILYRLSDRACPTVPRLLSTASTHKCLHATTSSSACSSGPGSGVLTALEHGKLNHSDHLCLLRNDYVSQPSLTTHSVLSTRSMELWTLTFAPRLALSSHFSLLQRSTRAAEEHWSQDTYWVYAIRLLARRPTAADHE